MPRLCLHFWESCQKLFHQKLLKNAKKQSFQAKPCLVTYQNVTFWPFSKNVFDNFRYFLQTIFSQFFIAVCQSLKTHVDQPIFWIQKLDKEGQSKQLHDAWIDLAQRIQKGSSLEQELVKCLMKWHGKQRSPESCWPQISLDGVTLLHISASCGIKSILKFIALYNDQNDIKNIRK